MKKFDVEITETLQRKVSVEATSQEDAERMVTQAWNNQDYVLDSGDFTGVDFKTVGEHELAETRTMDVLLVQPNAYPKKISVGTELEDLQAMVGGDIEVTYPFEDEVAIILNESGKINGLPLNRAIYTEDGDMKNGIEAMITDITATTAEAEDYTGEDGLLYCGKCHTPKEAYFAEGKTCFGRDRHPTDCDCQRAAREKQQAAESRQKHLEKVEDLKRRGFTDPAMRNWTFEHDNGRNPQTETARFYVESWETMQAENIGYLFWGGVGTGKSYLAACIANALMEKEVAVCMTNFATILGDLAASFEGRNEYISRLCSYPLLILDDFGMERGTEYGLEQVYSVIDSRYRSGKPLIATTNLTLEELQHPQDTPHARIYDRLTSMCAPVRFTGSNFRKETAQEKLERLKQLMKQRKESL